MASNAVSERAVQLADEEQPHILRYVLGNYVRVGESTERRIETEKALVHLTALLTVHQEGDIQAEDDFPSFIADGEVSADRLAWYRDAVAAW